ncbi:MAG TPA: AAA family ATPase, partial [Clostridiales bacterium]|nr:AAA family ATPase [Clostridiales bacterium]
MKRILIIGCSGSGKTTLARALGEKLELPVISLDGLWSGNATKAEFDSRLERALNLEGWIMDGNYCRTMDVRLSRCDTLIYLDFGRYACLQG